MNIGRELWTIKIDEEPETAPQRVEEPTWPERNEEPVPS
jgi:hypothetical protein